MAELSSTKMFLYVLWNCKLYRFEAMKARIKKSEVMDNIFSIETLNNYVTF